MGLALYTHSGLDETLDTAIKAKRTEHTILLCSLGPDHPRTREARKESERMEGGDEDCEAKLTDNLEKLTVEIQSRILVVCVRLVLSHTQRLDR